MNEKMIFEIGDIIHVRYHARYLLFRGCPLTAKDITECWEYKEFKKCHPEICRVAEKGGRDG